MDDASNNIAQLRRGALQFCVLASLRGEPKYGVELVQRLSSAGLTAGAGALYPVFSRLRALDYLSSEWRESDSGSPRRYYSLTPSGERALAEFLTDWTRFRSSVDRILYEDARDEPNR
jgi:PadR family transcriptional regulator